MIQFPIEFQYALAVAVGFYLGSLFHELSHWFVGWIGNTDPSILWGFYVFPNGVDHGRIETMDPTLIRLAGAAPFVWIPSVLVAIVFPLHEVSVLTAFLAALTASTQVVATESDAIAVRDSETFRQMWNDDEFDRNPLYLPNWIISDRLPRF